MPKTLSGLMAPAVTTFDRDGNLTKEPFLNNLRAHLGLGLDGILVAGSSGESALLDDADRHSLTEWAREAVPSDKWLLVGTGSESTRLTIQRCKDAKSAGADAALVISPHYFLKRMSEPALLAHFTRVADESPLPVLLYNMPAYTHLVMSPESVARMAAHDNVIGMKDSAGNLPVLEQYLQSQDPAFTVLTGNGSTVAGAIERGARGAILAIALYAGPAVKVMVDAALRGDHADAAARQQALVPVALEIAGALGPAGIKAAMDMTGLHGGAPRAPLLAVSDEERAKVHAVLRAGVPELLVDLPPSRS